jgi:nucleoside-diphosphate kinase
MVIQQTFVLIKPDGVARGLIGEIIKRFEQRGFKIVALKLVQVNKDFAKMHYTEEIEKRRENK